VQATLRAIDERASVGDDMLDRFAHDVFVYMKWPAVRAAIDAHSSLPRSHLISQRSRGDS